MSEEQSPTAALTESNESLEPTSQDVELAHRIVLRAQEHPLDNDRLGLIAAYDAVFEESGLDPEQDKVCYWLLFELLKPGVNGNTLYEKLEDVLRRKGIVLDYTEDLPKPQATAPSSAIDETVHHRHPIQSSPSSVPSQRPSQGSAAESDLASHQHINPNNEMDIVPTPPHIEQLMQAAIRIDRQNLLRQSLQMLRDHARLDTTTMERTAARMYQTKLKYKVFTHWYNVQRQASLDYVRADDFHVQHQATRSFATLFDTARVNRMQAMDEQRLRGMGLYKITIASRESTFRRMLEFRLKQKCMHKLMYALQTTSMQANTLDILLREKGPQLNNRHASRAMTHILGMAQQQRHQAAIANQKYEAHLLEMTWPRLQKAHDQIDEMKAVADIVRRFYLMQKYFRKMYWISQEKRARRLILGRRCVKIWQKFVKRQKEQRYQALYRNFRRDYKIRLARRCWQKMENKYNELRVIEETADQKQKARTDAFAHGLVVSWYHQAHDIKRSDMEAARFAETRTQERFLTIMTDRHHHYNEATGLVEKFYNLYENRRAERCWKQVCRKTFELQRRREDADAFRTRHERQTIRGVFNQWRQKAAESRGEGPLVLPPATPAQRRAEQLQRLASTTPLVPPRTSFAARLRAEAIFMEDLNEDDDG